MTHSPGAHAGTRAFLRGLRDQGVFVSLRGEDLSCQSRRGALSQSVLAQVGARKAEIVGFLRQASAPRRLSMRRAPRRTRVPVAYSQEALWFLHTLSLGGVCNSARAWRVEGPVDFEALRWALNEIVRRHESFRTHYDLHDGELLQSVFGPEGVEVAIERSAVDDDPTEATLLSKVCEVADRRFDLTRDVLLRAALIDIGPRSSVLVIAAHQLLYDGRSVDVMVDALSELYSARVRGDGIAVPVAAFDYVDFAYCQRRDIDGTALAAQRAYWRESLAPPFRLLALPRQPKAKASQPRYTQLRTVALPPDVGRRLVAMSRAMGVSFNVLMLAATKLHLALVTGQTDVLLYAYVSLRTTPALRNIIGLFTNVLMLRTTVPPPDAFGELAKTVQRRMAEALNHQELRLAEQYPLLGIVPEHADLSPFQCCYVFVNEPAHALNLVGCDLAPIHVPRFAVFDLITHVVQGGDRIESTYEYRDDLYTPHRIAALQDDFVRLLTQLVAQHE